MNEFTGSITIIRNQDNRFLLEQRNHKSPLDKWSWVFPGGGMEAIDKDHFATSVRETKEEFDIDLNPENLKNIAQFDDPVDKGIGIINFIEINQPERFIISESGGMGWFSLEEIKKIDLGYQQNDLVLPVLINYLKTL